MRLQVKHPPIIKDGERAGLALKGIEGKHLNVPPVSRSYPRLNKKAREFLAWKRNRK
jgi:hypothetical protein